jgi:hypothetical protein
VSEVRHLYIDGYLYISIRNVTGTEDPMGTDGKTICTSAFGILREQKNPMCDDGKMEWRRSRKITYEK